MKASTHSRSGCGGPATAASPHSSISPAGYDPTEPPSKQRSPKDSPTRSSNRPTPRSASSPAWPGASTDPNPPSPSPCSPSAATNPTSQAEHDPRISQESRYCLQLGLG